MRYRNAFFLFLAEGYTAFAAAVAGLLTARLLPVAEFGGFSAAFAFAQIISVLVDSGMGALVGKRIARNRVQAISDLDHIFTWRLLMTLAFTLLSPLLAYFFLPTLQMREMAVILTPSIILLTMTDFVSWVFKGTQRVKWCVVLQVGSRTLLLGLCIGALLSGRSLGFLIAAYGIAGALSTIFALYVLAKTTHSVRIRKLPHSFFVEVLPNL
jgi:O-antigen/teichoic acid export membrane protein